MKRCILASWLLHEEMALLVACFATHRSLWPSALVQGHLFLMVLGPSWPSKLWMCQTQCDSSGCWLPGAAHSIHMETFRRGNVALPSKCLILLCTHLPNHKGLEKSHMLLLNTQHVFKPHIFHHCCFPESNEGRDLITHKLC